MTLHVTSVILAEVAAPPLYHGGDIARYSEHLQLGGDSSDASQAQPGRKGVNVLRAVTTEAIFFQNRQG